MYACWDEEDELVIYDPDSGIMRRLGIWRRSDEAAALEAFFE